MKVLMPALLAASAAALHAALPGPAVNDAAVGSSGFPQTLAEYRFFADAPRQQPSRGVTPYRLNTPLWSDGAEKLRFVYVPEGMKAKASGDGLIGLPVGSALIKTFKYRSRMIETRVLLHRPEGWVALPYQWNAAQTEARLVLGGARVPVVSPAGEPISYAIPNKNQCKECHGLAGQVTPIGPKARNLAPEWLAAFAKAGHIDTVPAVARRLPLWEDRLKLAVEPAARGYLEVNCAHCHNPAGSASNSGLDLRWEQADPARLGILKHPVAAGRGAGAFEYDIVPGDPEHSILTYRMASTEGGIAMPELGKSTVDRDGVAAVTRWVREMRR